MPVREKWDEAAAVSWQVGYPRKCAFCGSEEGIEMEDFILDFCGQKRSIIFYWHCPDCQNTWWTESIISPPHAAGAC